MKNLYFHIGHGRTGTTSIQNYLMFQKENDNFLYPKTGLFDLGHHKLFEKNFPNINYGEGQINIFKELVREIDNSEKNNVIISSESGFPLLYFSKYNKIYLKSLHLLRKYNVKIIYYFREQFSAIRSSYLTHRQMYNLNIGIEEYFFKFKDYHDVSGRLLFKFSKSISNYKALINLNYLNYFLI